MFSSKFIGWCNVLLYRKLIYLVSNVFSWLSIFRNRDALHFSCRRTPNNLTTSRRAKYQNQKTSMLGTAKFASGILLISVDHLLLCYCVTIDAIGIICTNITEHKWQQANRLQFSFIIDEWLLPADCDCPNTEKFCLFLTDFNRFLLTSCHNHQRQIVLVATMP